MHAMRLFARALDCECSLSKDPDTGVGLRQQSLLQGSIVDEAVSLLQLEQEKISGE